MRNKIDQSIVKKNYLNKIKKIFSDFDFQISIVKIELLDKIKLENIVSNIYQENIVNMNLELKKRNNGLILLNSEKNASFLDITMIPEYFEDYKKIKESVSFKKIFVFPKQNTYDTSDNIVNQFTPFIEIFSVFFNFWSDVKVNIFPFYPENLFYDYDFYNFDFVSVSLISSLTFNDIQKKYRKNNFYLISGILDENSKSLFDQEDLIKETLMDLSKKKGFWSGSISEIKKITELNEEEIFKFLNNNLKKTVNIDYKKRKYFGPEFIFIIEKKKVTIISFKYFLEKNAFKS